MTPIVLIAVVALVVALWPAATFPAFLCCIVIGIVVGAVQRAHSATPATIRRLPTGYERSRRRRWRLGFGLALGFHGVFPFVYVTRRVR